MNAVQDLYIRMFIRHTYSAQTFSEILTSVMLTLNLYSTFWTSTFQLVLNADDLVSARLAKGNDRVYFGIEKQDNEVLNENTIIIDTPLCPECGSRLEYDFRRYHHIGSAHCTKCGFRSPKADYDVTKVNESTGRITMSLKGKQADFKAVGTSVTDTYNLAGAIAVLSEFGLSAEQLKKSVEKLEIVKSRYDEEKIGDKQVIMSVAKGQNPVGCSRVFSSIKNHTGKNGTAPYIAASRRSRECCL